MSTPFTATSNPPALLKDVTIRYHVAPLDPPSNEINSFWFDDSADLVCDLERKLGVDHRMGDLIDMINEMGVDELQAHKDPTNRSALLVSATEDGLKDLLEGITTAVRRRTAIEDRTMPDAEILAIAADFDVTGVIPETMHASTIALAEAAWKARDEISAS